MILNMASVDYSRELSGPDSYQYFDSISLNCQKRYVLLQNVMLGGLLFISLLSFLPIYDSVWVSIREIISIGIMLIILVLLIIQSHKNYMEGWQKGRYLAESILSATWLFLFDVERDLGSYHKEIKALKSEIDMRDYLSLAKHPNKDDDQPDWLTTGRAYSLEDKIAFYLKYRLNDQISWYSRKSISNGKSSSRLYIAALITIVVGILLSILTIANVILPLGYLSFFTTVMATIFSYREMKRSEELETTYGVAAEELRGLKSALMNSKVETEIMELIELIENAVSREHKIWFFNSKRRL